MWFAVRPARSPGSRALLLSVLIAGLFAASGSSWLLAQSAAPASTDIRRSASETGIADPRLDARVESLLRRMTLE
jgi:hypothetical protein